MAKREAQASGSRTRRPKSTLLALSALSVVAAILRYPVSHEEGVDSYLIHGIAGAIAATGSMKWLVNPLSFIGLAPFSYAPAVPVSMAAFSGLSGLDLEPAALAYSLLLGCITPWIAFLLGREACGNDGVSLLVAFLFTTSQGVVGLTDWSLSARGTFLVFTPLAMTLLLKSAKDTRRLSGYWMAFLLVSAVLMLVHALWLLLLPGLVAAWLAYRFALAEHSLLRGRLGNARTRDMVLGTSVLVGLLLLLLITFVPTEQPVGTTAPQLLGGVLPNTTLVGIGLQYATLMGIGIVLFPVGAYKLALAPESRKTYVFLALALVFLPVSVDPTYGVLLGIPVVLFVSAAAFLPKPIRRPPASRRSPNRRLWAGICIAALVVAVPPLVTIPRASAAPCNQGSLLDGQTYDAGLYVRYLPDQNFSFAWDAGIEASRIQAISGVPAIEPLESVGTLEYPWLERKVSLSFTTQPNLVTALVQGHQLIGVREWIPAAGTDYGYYWSKHTFVLLQSAPDSIPASQILNFYQARYAIQRCSGSDGVFFAGLHSSNYLIYTDERQGIFSL